MNPSEVLVHLQGICKSFGNVQANKDVELLVRRGSIHALVGENGAGKTTLMKILFGLEQQDAGEIIYGNQKVKINSPQQAMRLGIGMVHQHFMQVPSLTVAENVVLGQEPRRGLKLDLSAARQLVREVSTRYGWRLIQMLRCAISRLVYSRGWKLSRPCPKGQNCLS